MKTFLYRRFHPILLAFVLFVSFATLAIGGGKSLAQVDPNARDCDANAVIMCGALTLDELKTKYNQNQGGNVQALYSNFGIANVAALDGMVEGSVSAANNSVYVGNSVVATNAITAGRQNISNSRGSSTPIMGGAFYQRSPSVSFTNPNGSLRALVKMENGQFKYAVLTSCGNPVKAVPNAPPPTPTPSPPPTFEVTKEVRMAGQTDWASTVTVKPGDHVQFRISVRNTGQVDLQNVNVRDELPPGLNNTDLSLEQPGATTSPPDLFTTGTMLATIIKPGAPVQLVFEVVVNNSTESCQTPLINTAIVKPSNAEEKRATASLLVCKPPAPPAAVTPTPPALPNTGPANVPVIISLATASGVIVYRYYLFWRRFLEQRTGKP